MEIHDAEGARVLCPEEVRWRHRGLARERGLHGWPWMRALIALILVVSGVVFGVVPGPLAARAELDPRGRVMLDRLGAQGLRPDELIARLKLKPHAMVADVGAGPGFFTLPLAAAVPGGRVIATDVRDEYLAAAAERAHGAGLANIETRV